MNSEFTSQWFDESTRAWLANKKRNGHQYKYVCGVEKCVKGCLPNSLNCVQHQGCGIILPYKVLPSLQESGQTKACSRHLRIGEFPSEQKDLGVAYRVAHRRRAIQSQ